MARKKKYLTEEEKKAAHREACKRYREKNPEKVSETQKRYYRNNTEKVSKYQKQYREENPEKERERHRRYSQENKEKINQYREENKEHIKEYNKQYRKDNKEYFKEYNKQYYQTPMRRASALVRCYQREDKKYNRGECTITPEWMIENIFTKPCHYCGKEGWEIMGCDRIDNSKPHTPDNVVPCCGECNKKRGSKSYEEFIEKMLAENPC